MDENWEYSKLARVTNDGVLILEESNLTHILSSANDLGAPITILAFYGSTNQDRAFCTNLLAKELKANEWEYGMNSTTFGFAWGDSNNTEENYENAAKFYPVDSLEAAMYCWPELLPLHKKLVLLLYAHEIDNDKMSNAIVALLNYICSAIGQIRWNSLNLEGITNASHDFPHIVSIVKQNSALNSGQEFNEFYADVSTISSEFDIKFQISDKQRDQLKKLKSQLTDETKIKVKYFQGKLLTSECLPDFLRHTTNKVNAEMQNKFADNALSSSPEFDIDNGSVTTVTTPPKVVKYLGAAPDIVADSLPKNNQSTELIVQQVYGSPLTGMYPIECKKPEIDNDLSTETMSLPEMDSANPLKILDTYNRLSQVLFCMYEDTSQVKNCSLLSLKSFYEQIQLEHYEEIEELARKISERVQKYQTVYSQTVKSHLGFPRSAEFLSEFKKCHDELFSACIHYQSMTDTENQSISATEKQKLTDFVPQIPVENPLSTLGARKSIESICDSSVTFERSIYGMRSMRIPKTRQHAQQSKPVGNIMAFHVNPERIGFAKFTPDDDRPGEIFYQPASLMLTHNNEFMFGCKQSNIESSNPYWELSFLLTEREKKNTESQLTSDMSIECLLGVIFNISRQLVNIQACDTLIAIPSSFPSSRRQHIADAASIAGFDRARLVSETSSSAYYLFSTLKIPIENELVILSENGDNVEMILYVYNKTNKSVVVLTRCGSQENNAIKRYAEKTRDSRLISKSTDNYALILPALLNAMWNIMLERADTPISKLPSEKRSALICSDSENTLRIFKSAAKNICGVKKVMIEKESVAKGLFCLYKSDTFKSTFSTETMIQDFIPFNLFYSSFLGENYNNLGVSCKQYNESISMNISEMTSIPREIRQVNQFEIASSLGSFTFSCEDENVITCIIYFSQTQDGILHFDYAECEVQEGKDENSIMRYELYSSVYEWKPSTLNADDRLKYKKLVENLKYRQLESKAEKQKKKWFS